MTLLLVLLAALGLVATACGDDGVADTNPQAVSGAGGAALDGTLTVSAATSLRAAFTEIAESFEAANPGVEITFNFDASSALATQIIEGAPADVFASADDVNMARLTDEGLVAGAAKTFARNGLVIVTKPGNPQGITSLADLTGAGVVSLCGEAVPCGRYAQEALDAAGASIPESSITRGQNVGATLTAVAEGDAVAGIVYVTDAVRAGEAVDVVAIPAEHDVTATYPIAVLAGAGNSEAAEAFLAHVRSDVGQVILEEHGFLGAT